jgi:hypothetical protein
VTFTAPPPRPGSARSFVLKAAGYYTILLPQGGSPRMARFESLLREPGALARFAAEEARQTARAAAGEER